MKNNIFMLILAGNIGLGAPALLAGTVTQSMPQTAMPPGTEGPLGAPAVTAAPHSDPVPILFQPDLARCRKAVFRAVIWLNDTPVDPLDLRAHGVKGKKKLAELLDSYRRCLDAISDAGSKAEIRAQIKKAAAVTYDARYHDMGTISDLWFKQDSTSYLRVAYLLDQLGLDTTLYREEIGKVLPRLNAHMASRGADQQRTFHNYYRHFKLTEPFPLESALAKGYIAARTDCRAMAAPDVYNFTHEVFALYEFGDRLDARPFTDEDQRYLREQLGALIKRFVREGNIDLVAELVTCEQYARLCQSPEYQDGVEFVLNGQNADGSWGRYENERQWMGDYVRQGLYLHTTMVALETVVMALP